MRTTHISPEFIYSNVNGTLSMLEKKSFMCSKLMKFDDAIYIKNQNIIYYQTPQNEQLNFDNEKLLTPLIYNADNDKQTNSSLIIEPSQNNSQLVNNTAWILTINYGKIIMNYLFATLKRYRTFEGVTNNITMNNDINAAIIDYINVNLLSRYQFYKIELYIGYNDLTNGGLRLQNNWDPKVEIDSNLVNKIQTNTNSINQIIEATFNQEQISADYSFNYYYNLYFTKI